MEAKKNRFLIYLLVAIVAGFIFVCWLYLLPYILKKEKIFGEQKNNFQKVDVEVIDTLDEIKQVINDLGDKIKELKAEGSPLGHATSTEAAEIVQQESDINLLKEKILENYEKPY